MRFDLDKIIQLKKRLNKIITSKKNRGRVIKNLVLISALESSFPNLLNFSKKNLVLS